MKRKKKLYVRPKKAYEKSRIEEENVLLDKYGLKNKKEVWKAQAKVDYFRRRAKSLARSPLEEQQILFGKLKAIGFKTDTIADVLALNVENLLNRRLPTIVARKGLATTPQQARQMVVHKKIFIDGKAVDSPSYIVKVSEEDLIVAKIKQVKAKEVKQENKEAQEIKPVAEVK